MSKEVRHCLSMIASVPGRGGSVRQGEDYILLGDESIKRKYSLVVSRFLFAVFGFLLWQFRIGKIRQRIVPQVMIEPGEIVLHDGALRFRFGNRMAKALVNDHLDFDAFVF